MKSVFKSATLLVGITSFAFSMELSEEQKKISERRKTLNQWKSYIENKKFSDNYFNTKQSLELIKNIIIDEKGDQELSQETIEVIKELSKKCAYVFNRKRFDKNSECYKNNVINMILDDTEIPKYHSFQVIKALITYTKSVEQSEYYRWFLQAALHEYTMHIFYFFDSKLSRLIFKNIFLDMAQMVIKQLGNSYDALMIICKFLGTADALASENLRQFSQKNTIYELDTQKIEFFKKLKRWLYELLCSETGLGYVINAHEYECWDYIKYCVTWELGSAGTQIISNILKSKDLTAEKKRALLRNCLSCAQQCGGLRMLLGHNQHKFFEDLATSECKDLLPYAIKNYDNGEKNLLVNMLLDEKQYTAKSMVERITKIFDALEKRDQYDLLNPRKGQLPLMACHNKINNLDIFRFLVKSGALLYKKDTFSLNDWSVCFNPCSFGLFMQEKKYNGRRMGLSLFERWNYLKYCIKQAKKQGKNKPRILHKMLNQSGVTSPLLLALMDEGDTEMVMANYLIKHGASFDVLDPGGLNMLSVFILHDFFDHEERKLGLNRLLKLVDNAAFLFNESYLYPLEQIGNLIEFLEKSDRKDKSGCLYMLLKNLTSEQFQEVRKKVNRDNAPCTYKFMKKIEQSMDNLQERYKKLRPLNARLATIGMHEKHNLNEYQRGKYAYLV